MPAATILDDAPYRLPFPPSVGPNAKANTSGLMGICNTSFVANDTTILTIIAVTGIESTTAEVKADI